MVSQTEASQSAVHQSVSQQTSQSACPPRSPPQPCSVACRIVVRWVFPSQVRCKVRSGTHEHHSLHYSSSKSIIFWLGLTSCMPHAPPLGAPLLHDSLTCIAAPKTPPPPSPPDSYPSYSTAAAVPKTRATPPACLRDGQTSAVSDAGAWCSFGELGHKAAESDCCPLPRYAERQHPEKRKHSQSDRQEKLAQPAPVLPNERGQIDFLVPDLPPAVGRGKRESPSPGARLDGGSRPILAGSRGCWHAST